MAYDWTEPSQGGESERLPVNVALEVEITRIVFAKKDGTPFKSQAGDPKIMVVMTDDEGRECAMMVTLSAKGSWVLRAILSAAGADMAKMKADNVELAWFADEAFGRANLVGRRLTIRVKKYVSDDGNLAEIEAIRRSNTTPPPATPTPPPAATDPMSDIPF